MPDDPLFKGTTAPDPSDRFGDDPGPWFLAGFDSECSHGDQIEVGEIIRADGEGGYEHRECFEDDAVITGMTRSGDDYRGWKEGDLW
jgi:hypothetical protein